MKLNNKGYLIIEIVLSAAIAFAIMYFLLELTFNFKSKNDDLYKETLLISDKNIITKTIMDDINSMGVTKLDFACNQGNYRCVDITYNSREKEENITKRFRINTQTNEVQYGIISGDAYIEDREEYYYEKSLSEDLTIGTVNVINNCYGTDVTTQKDSNNILICEANSSGDSSDTLKNNGLFTINFNATSQFLENDYGINITIPYNNLEVKIDMPPCFNFQSTIPAAPELPDGMIPIKYDGTSIKKANVTNNNNDWYNYSEGKWANAVMVTSGTRTTYINAPIDTEILANDIVAYYVWIPRYSYQLFEENQTVMSQACLNFENATDPKSNGINQPGSNERPSLTHPAFTFGSTELNGIWASKFKSTGTSISAPKSKPNAMIGKLTLISRQYQQAQKFSQYLTTTGQSTHDVHMLKNTDWGAIAYLTYSAYGICNKDGNCSTIVANNTDYSGGGSAWMTTNINQSSTNTIYGVYDMKSSSNEHVMGNFGNIIGSDLAYPESSASSNYNHSNFNGYIYNFSNYGYKSPEERNSTVCTERLQANGTGVNNCIYNGIKDSQGNYYGAYGAPLAFPTSTKYYDLYELVNSSNKFEFNKAFIKGDATYEVKSLEEINKTGASASSWVTDAECTEINKLINNLPGPNCQSHTWYARGNINSIFYFTTTTGSGNNLSSRSVITKK